MEQIDIKDLSSCMSIEKGLQVLGRKYEATGNMTDKLISNISTIMDIKVYSFQL